MGWKTELGLVAGACFMLWQLSSLAYNGITDYVTDYRRGTQAACSEIREFREKQDSVLEKVIFVGANIGDDLYASGRCFKTRDGVYK